MELLWGVLICFGVAFVGGLLGFIVPWFVFSKMQWMGYGWVPASRSATESEVRDEH